MSADGSVSRWLEQLQEGDAAAVGPLWERYFLRLVDLARTRLQSVARCAADEEDVALSAFHSFCRRAEQGQFPDVLDRDSLWRLLVAITVRKAAHLRRDESRLKRGGGKATLAETPEGPPLLEQILSREPTPELAAEMVEECQRLLARLGDRELEQVAVGRMEGRSVEEIGAKLGYAPRSIKRKLHLIRSIWESEISP